MAVLAYPYSVRDSANTSTDNRATGLTPTVSNGKTLASSPATVTASGNVTPVEIGSGDYIFLYDAEAHADASFPVDWGSSLTNPNDRYGTLILTRDAGRLLTALPNAAPAASGGLPTVGTGTGQISPASGKVPATLADADLPADLRTASGLVVVGSTGTSVVVSGLPSGKTYAGQHLFQMASGEARTITSQSFGSGNYTFTFAVGFSAVSTNDVVVPIP